MTRYILAIILAVCLLIVVFVTGAMWAVDDSGSPPGDPGYLDGGRQVP